MTATPRLRPAAEIEPEESMRAYFERLRPGAGNVGNDLPRFVNTVFQRSMEAVWPSMLATGRQVSCKGPLEAGGWKFESVKTSNPWQVAFTARQGGSGGGLLYVANLDKERTDAAAACRNEAWKHVYAIPDLEERKAEIAKILMGEIIGDDRATQVTDEFRDPSEVARVEEVAVYAFKGEGSLEFYDGFAETLEGTVEAVGKGKWCHGLIGQCRPTADHLGIEPSDSSLDRTSQMAAAMESLRILSLAVEAAGFGKDVQERGRKVSSWSYAFFGDESDRHVSEAAQVAVYCDSGFAAQHSWEAVWEFWKDSVEMDLSARAGQIAETVSMLRDAGYVSMESRYDCNDLDDFAHVVMDGRGFGTLWLETQNGRYGIAFRQDGNSLSHLSMARVDEGFGRSPMGINPSAKGFLGAFEASAHPNANGRRYLSVLMGRLRDRTIRDINNILLTLESVHCCLEADPASARRP